MSPPCSVPRDLSGRAFPQRYSCLEELSKYRSVHGDMLDEPITGNVVETALDVSFQDPLE